MNIRVLVVDDERLARARIRQLLELERDMAVVGESQNGREALACIQAERPDLLFLDIQMPGMSGFDLLRALSPDCRPAVVFVSARAQHALEAFEVHALDYLLKPFKLERFRETLQRAREYFQLHALEKPPVRFGPNEALVQPLPRPKHLTIKTGGRTRFIPVTALDYVESASNYAILHVGAESHVLRETLKHLALQLPAEEFLRVSRSAIVNVSFVHEVRRVARRERRLVLKNGKELPVTCGVGEIRRRLECI